MNGKSEIVNRHFFTIPAYTMSRVGNKTTLSFASDVSSDLKLRIPNHEDQQLKQVIEKSSNITDFKLIDIENILVEVWEESVDKPQRRVIIVHQSKTKNVAAETLAFNFKSKPLEGMYLKHCNDSFNLVSDSIIDTSNV